MVALASTAGVLAQTSELSGVEYWFNSDFAGRTTIAVSGGTVNVVDILHSTALPAGIHTAHIRARDNAVPNDGSANPDALRAANWSAVYSILFVKLPQQPSTGLAAYEYWMDDRYAQRQTAAANGASFLLSGSLDLGSLDAGIHTLHIRAKDESGRWSAIHSQVFYKYPAFEDNKASAYRYWFNDDEDNALTVAITGAGAGEYELNVLIQVPEELLGNASNVFNIQFCDIYGNWSTAESKSFSRTIEPVADITLDISTTITADTPVTLTATVEPDGAANTTVIWTVKNAGTTGATITKTADGYVLNTTGAGTVVILATIPDGKGNGEDYTKEFTITVNAAFEAVTGITLDVSLSSVKAGTPVTLAATVAPDNASNQTVVWSVVNAGTTGATINGNVLNTTGAGVVVIRATIIDGSGTGQNYVKEFTITVSAVTGVSEMERPNPLKAWTRNGLLHITGLTAGKPLSVYNAAGAPVYQNIAASGEADIPLAVQGVYMVRQGDFTIKVSFNH